MLPIAVVSENGFPFIAARADVSSPESDDWGAD
jgi:hypothetical protein